MFLTQQEINHSRFIASTDRKSLYNQVTKLVKKAESVVHDDLLQRRKRLQQKLEEENDVYQEEFAETVRTRIDNDIKRRNDVLVKTKEQASLERAKFLEKKLIQRRIENCQEIREALRAKETQYVKESQLEQITERERAIMRERKREDYWRKVRDRNFERYDQNVAEEADLKAQVNCQIRCSWDEKLHDIERKRQQKREIKRQEAEEIDKVMGQIKLEAKIKASGPSPKQLAYGSELLNMIKESKERREAEERQAAEEHRELVRKIQREEREALAAIEERKRAFHKSALEYIDFVRSFRKIGEKSQKIRDDRIEDLRRVDICTKSNLLAEAKRRAEVASRYYAELRRQLCDEYERRIREKAEQREQKIIENRFVREEKSHVDILKEQRKFREELDAQIAELARIRAEEEAEFDKDVRATFDDPELCTQLAEKYLSEGLDTLPPHANWRILACPQKEYVQKERVAFDDVPPEGRPDCCIKPCGCDVISPLGKECQMQKYLIPEEELAKRKSC